MKLFNQFKNTKQITAERHGLLQYACYRLGNLHDAEDAVQDVEKGITNYELVNQK